MEVNPSKGTNSSFAGQTPGSNSSNLSAGLLHLPPTFLDAIIPGYSVLASSLLSHFGIDLSFYVSLLALFFAATTALQVTINPVIERVLSSITSTVVVDEYDSIFSQMLDWLSSQPSLQNHRILRAHTGAQFDADDEGDVNTRPSNTSPDIIFNFGDFATRVPARYEPHSTTGFFRHNGHVFRISREAERVQNEWSETVRDREKFTVTVVWRSTKPIKALIEEARELSFSKRTSTTTILRPTPKQQRGHGNEWQVVTNRPSRSLDTVVLDDEQKLRCVSDINEFLQAARWYSNRGIPYRRGYLFWGKPGTGKTSLSFALAGLFGLSIYCLSLSEVTLTEEDLIMLFTALPPRCIVLLEDIDCAGVSRPKPADKKSKKKSKKKSSSKSKSDTNNGKLSNAITISGLLNAIDGVATAEGRILIMTTNFPDKLDSALTRPGRVDMRIGFQLANQQQIKELFLRMYSADNEESNKQPTKISQIVSRRDLKPSESQPDAAQDRRSQVTIVAGTDTPDSDSAEKQGLLTPSSSSPPSEDGTDSAVDLEQLSTLFAASLPDCKFSPAEIQGFLLYHKNSPLQAVTDVGAWRDEEVAKKEVKERHGDKKDGEKETQTQKVAHHSESQSQAAAQKPDEANGDDVVLVKAEAETDDVKEKHKGKSDVKTSNKTSEAKAKAKDKAKKKAEESNSGSDSDSASESDSSSASSSDDASDSE